MWEGQAIVLVVKPLARVKEHEETPLECMSITTKDLESVCVILMQFVEICILKYESLIRIEGTGTHRQLG